jgi:WD40 repeat protein
MTLLSRRTVRCLSIALFGLGLCAQDAVEAQESSATFTLPAGAEIVLQLGHSSDGAYFEFSPDQRLILSAGSDGTLKLWDIGTGRLLRTMEGREASGIDQAVFSPDGTRVLSGGIDGVRLWDVKSGALLRSLAASLANRASSFWEMKKFHFTDYMAKHARAVAFSADGKYLVSGHRDHTVRLWDAETGALLRTFEGQGDEVGSVAFSPDGQFILSAGSRGTTNDGVLMWDARTGAIVRQFKVYESAILPPSMWSSRAFGRGALKISADGRYLCAQSIDSKYTVWNFNSGTVLHRSTAAAISPDGRRLAVGTLGNDAEIRDADTGQPISKIVAQGLFLGLSKFSPNGRMIGGISADRAIVLWNADDGRLVRTFLGNQQPIRAVAFAGDGRRVVTGNDAGLLLWNEAKLIRSMPSSSAIKATAWASDGNLILAGVGDRTIGLWDAAKGEMTRRFELRLGGGYGVTSVSFGVDDNRVLAANGSIAEMFDVQTGAVIRTFGGAYSAAFSRDGRRVVTGGSSVDVWDVETGAVRRKIEIPGGIHAVGFSSSGNMVVSGTDGHRAFLLDSRSGAFVRALNGHQGNVRVAAFSPDGSTLLTGGFENTLRLWSAESGSFISDFRGHQGWITGASFAPDGKRFVSVGYDGTMRLWDTDTGRLLITTIVRNGEWLSVTPAGLFVTSGDPRDFIAITKGFDVLPMEEFIMQNRRDSLGSLFAGVK